MNLARLEQERIVSYGARTVPLVRTRKLSRRQWDFMFRVDAVIDGWSSELAHGKRRNPLAHLLHLAVIGAMGLWSRWLLRFRPAR
jgi:hypothetical protein